MKTALITFIAQSKTMTTVCNGFSSIRHLFPNADDIFYDIVQSPDLDELTMGYDKIYCSVFYDSQMSLIIPYLDSRWTLGGPVFEPDEDYSHYVNSDLPCTIIRGRYEDYIDIPTSSEFHRYWEDKILPNPNSTLWFSFSQGSGCYWGKCTFCSRDDIKTRMEFNPKYLTDVRGWKDYRVTTGYGATPLSNIRSYTPHLKDLHKHKIDLRVLIRSDKGILNYLESISDLKGLNLGIGGEFMSTQALKILDKGFTAESVLRVIKLAERGCGVRVTVIGRVPFINREIYEEGMRILSDLDEILSKLPEGSYVEFTGIKKHFVWTLKEAEELQKKYGGEISLGSISPFGDRALEGTRQSYKVYPEKGSENYYLGEEVYLKWLWLKAKYQQFIIR